MKFHFQVIDSYSEEYNPVISGANGYEALHTLVEVCKYNTVIPTRISLVQTDDDEDYLDENSRRYHRQS